MALSVSLHNEAAVELFDLTDQEYNSDVTSTGDSDQEDFSSVPRAFERVVPRNLKRTYGVLVDSSSVLPERRLRTRVDEQLEFLRAILPNSCTVSTKPTTTHSQCDGVFDMLHLYYPSHRPLSCQWPQ